MRHANKVLVTFALVAGVVPGHGVLLGRRIRGLNG